MSQASEPNVKEDGEGKRATTTSASISNSQAGVMQGSANEVLWKGSGGRITYH